MEGRFMHGTTVYRPKAAKNSEEGGFATTVGADDEKVIALLERERQGFDKDITVR